VTQPILPRPDDPIGRGIDRLVELRPAALAFIDRGRYGHVFAGWRAQLAVLIERLAAEVAARRLPLATGAALLDLCASEFDTVLPTTPTIAVGEVTLARSLGSLPAGAIRKGFTWRRPADPADPYLPKSEVAYESTEDTVVPQGATTATVKIQATRAGAFANIPIGPGPVAQAIHANDIQPGGPLFDTNLAPVMGLAAGGADGTSEDLLRRAARAYALGRYAPTLGAIGAAALRAGAAQAAVFDVPSRGLTVVLADDVSWATSITWVSKLQSAVLADAAGFGCRVLVSSATNTFVRVACTITVRDGADLVDTSEMSAALGAAVRAYLDNRPDWYTWRLGALRGVCARAHPRILTCSQVVVRDAVTNAVLNEPTTNPRLGFFDSGNRPYHYLLCDNAVQTTYLVPT
jgi:hypothetical protein